jgi:hypothetical protein
MDVSGPTCASVSVCYDHDKTVCIGTSCDDREDAGEGERKVKRARSLCSRRVSPNTEAHAESGLEDPLPYRTV